MYQHDGKVALVTGAASGIGESVATILAQRGACVVLADLNKQAVDGVAATLANQGLKVVACELNVVDAASCSAAVALAVERFGKLDLAVNSAGVPTPFAKVADVEFDDWKRQVDVNLSGVFNCLRAEIPEMLKAGGGSIVNLASILGVQGMAGRSAYTASKHGVVGLTRACALDYAEQHIRVNAICPGYADTPLLQGRGDDERRKIAELHPIGRMSTAIEQAEFIAFLLSDSASFATGGIFMNDGAYSTR